MEMNLFEIGVNIFEDLMIYTFLTMYFGCKYDGVKKAAGFIAAVAIDVILLTALNFIYFYEGFLGLIFILVYFLYDILFLKGDVYTKLFIACFTNCILYTIGPIVMMMTMQVLKVPLEQLMELTPERVLLIVSGKVLFAVVCIVLLKNKISANKRNLALMIIITIVTMASDVGVTQIYTHNNSLSGPTLLASAGVILENVLSYYVFIKMSRDAEKDEALANARLSEERLNMQVGQYKAMVQSQNELKKVRHDLKNHLIAIDAKLDKGDYNDCSNYVHTLLKEVSGYAASFNTGNTVLDAILSAKETDAKQRGIKFTARLNIPSDLPIEDNDICAIFGNALDNAIEACEKVKNNPYINVLLSYDKGTLTCKIENSCMENANNSLITTKADVKNHGIGKMNIQRALDKYCAVSDVKIESGTYTLSIVFMDI